MPAAQLYTSNNQAGYADVILPLNMPGMLTYGVPVDMQERIQVGMRVEVALGRNKLYSGIVGRLHSDKPDAYQVKPIRALLDEEPVVNEMQLKFWQWIAEYYIAALGEVMQAALPAHLKLTGETRVQWMPANDDVVYEWSDMAFAAADELERRKELKLSELRAITGVRHFAEVLNELLENETIIIHDELETAYRPKKEKVVRLNPVYKEEAQLHQLFDELQRAPKQLSLLMAYIELSVKFGAVKQEALIDRASATTAQVKALADKNIFNIEEVSVDRIAANNIATINDVVLTPAQQKAYDELATVL